MCSRTASIICGSFFCWPLFQDKTGHQKEHLEVLKNFHVALPFLFEKKIWTPRSRSPKIDSGSNIKRKQIAEPCESGQGLKRKCFFQFLRKISCHQHNVKFGKCLFVIFIIFSQEILMENAEMIFAKSKTKLLFLPSFGLETTHILYVIYPFS